MSDDARPSEGPGPRGGVAAVLLIDGGGPAALWSDPPGPAESEVGCSEQTLDGLITEHGGLAARVSNGGVVAGVFASASEAVAAALGLQRAATDRHGGGGAAGPCRVAVHTGTVIRGDDGTVWGSGISRAERLLEIGHRGQTLLSDSTQDWVIDHLPAGVSLRYLGPHRLKDLGQPERLWQLCHPDLVDAFAPLWSLDALPTNLPGQPTSFVGRESETAAVAAKLAADRLVTLTGTGGVGKSRLALQVAARLAGSAAGGVWWVELGPLSDPERVPHAVATVLGYREQQERPLIDTLVEQLRAAELVLVVDNCEHVLEAAAALIGSLLAAVPGLRVLATSREPLGAPGEVTWRVPSLDEHSSTDLFKERAAQVRPRSQAPAGEDELIARICGRLDGLPLAIELAAARTRMMSVARIADSLDDRFRLLTGAPRGAVARQQTLEASVGWSYDLLDEREQAVLRRLSVFAGGFSLDAAEAVCAEGTLVDRYAVLDLLASLVDKSLVVTDDQADTRYRLLETVRGYAAVRLIEAAETEAARTRHLGFFLADVEAAEPTLAGPEGPIVLARLESERDNLRAALDWAETTEAHETALRLLTGLAVFWVLRGHTTEGGRRFARSLERDAGPSVVRARALWGAAHVALYGDDHHTTALRCPQALAMAHQVGDPWTMARATNVGCYVSLWTDPAGARAQLARSIELARDRGDNWGELDGLKMMTIAYQVEDDHEGASPYFDQLHATAQRLGNNFYLAWYYHCLAYAALRRGRFEDARRHCERSLQLCETVGDPSTAGVTIAWLGEIETATGQRDAARARYEAFLQRAAATGGDWGFPFVFINLACLLTSCGEAQTSAMLTGAAIAQGRNEPDRPPLIFAWILAVYGAALLASGEPAAAAAALAEADQIAAATHNPWLKAITAHCLGRLARHQGDTSRAEDHHHHALALCHANHLPAGGIEALESLAGLAAHHQSATEAARLLSAATTQRASLGLVRLPDQQQRYDDDLAAARRQLDQGSFEQAWAEGAALTPDDAVAYATRARGQRRRPTTGWPSLTPTETEVVNLVAQGLTNPQIAEQLFISRATVKTHLIHIFAKLEVTNRAQLAIQATRRTVSPKT